jgi:phosphoribosylformimino-5-aminoimidazole carboxamide ribotide isomerase
VLLIPAIDLQGGRCVRLYQGDFGAPTAYAATPEELLARYRELGASWVHVVDLDRAQSGARDNRALIGRLAAHAPLSLQVGGGVRSAADIEELFDAGVARVVIGSAAADASHQVRDWLERFGPERLTLAFDVRLEHGGEPQVRTHGWTAASGRSLWQVLADYPRGAMRHVLCTDIERDGALTGPNLDLYRAALARAPELAWQASGGVRDAADLAALARLGVAAAVSGKALLEQRITHEELRPFLPDASFPVSTSATAGS